MPKVVSLLNKYGWRLICATVIWPKLGREEIE